MGYLELSKQELEKEYGNLVKRFEECKHGDMFSGLILIGRGLNLEKKG